MQSQLLYNQWFGKAVGFTCAFIFAPRDGLFLSLFVIAGIALGHLFDLWAQYYAGQSAALLPSAIRGSNAHKQPEATPHLHFLFAGLGHVARETGTIKQQQIDLVEKLIQELELGGSGREQAVTWFEEGKAGTTSFDRLARQCRTGRFTRARLRPLALTQMCRIAAVQPTQKAYDAVIRLGAMQGISPRRATAEFTRTMGGANVKRQQPSKAAQNAQQSELHAAYKTLGLPISASKGQAKHAYRRLVNKHHPDKLGPNISTANKAKAEATLIELRAALDLINGQP